MCAHVSWPIYAAQQSRHIQAADRFGVAVARGVTQSTAASCRNKHRSRPRARSKPRSRQQRQVRKRLLPTVQNSRNDVVTRPPGEGHCRWTCRRPKSVPTGVFLTGSSPGCSHWVPSGERRCPLTRRRRNNVTRGLGILSHVGKGVVPRLAVANNVPYGVFLSGSPPGEKTSSALKDVLR